MALFASGAATAVTARKAGGICLDLTSDDARLRRYYVARTAVAAPLAKSAVPAKSAKMKNLKTPLCLPANFRVILEFGLVERF